MSNNSVGVPTNASVLPLPRAMRTIKHSGWHWWSGGRRWKIRPSLDLSETSLSHHAGDNLKCQPRAEAEAIVTKQSPDFFVISTGGRGH